MNKLIVMPGCALLLTLLVLQKEAGERNSYDASSSDAKRIALRWEEIIRSDNFDVPENSVYPTPKVIGDGLRNFIVDNYDENCAIRTLMVEYFLRYDFQLLERGILTASPEKSNLIGILWDMECRRHPRFRETPSTTEMREYVSSNVQWFCLEDRHKEMITRNDSYLKRIVNHDAP
jgi:hypothetical protein